MWTSSCTHVGSKQANEALAEHAVHMNLGGAEVLVGSLEDLVRSKQPARRLGRGQSFAGLLSCRRRPLEAMRFKECWIAVAAVDPSPS